MSQSPEEPTPSSLYFSTALNSTETKLISTTHISDAMREFIERVVGESPDQLLKKPIITLPSSEQQLDDSWPLTHYFISSSHNTYLLSRQLIGTSSASAYTNVILRGCACVEVDLWWRSSSSSTPSSRAASGLRVTHGWTLSSSVDFGEVCAAIAEGVEGLEKRYSAAGGSRFPPVLISLENHVPAERQHLIIEVVKRYLGRWVVLGKLEGGEEGDEEGTVRLRDLRGRVVVMVEYYPRDPVGEVVQGVGEFKARVRATLKEGEGELSSESDSSSDSSFEDEELEGESKLEGIWPRRREEKTTRAKITDALAALGYYCRSMKPGKGWWEKYIQDPKHILINISESKHEPLLALPALPLDSTGEGVRLTPLQTHSLTHLRRVYPRGTRIKSGNMVPSKYWRSGTQIVGVNWQRCDVGGAIGGAMFAGSSNRPSRVGIESWVDERPTEVEEEGRGYVLKPGWLRGMGDDRRARKIGLEVWGGCGLTPSGELYVQVELYSGDKVEEYKSAGLECNWESDFVEDGVSFLRIGVYRDDRWSRDDLIGWFCARTNYLVTEGQWRILKMVDKYGKYRGGIILARVTLY